jgi:hypothetical protein
MERKIYWTVGIISVAILIGSYFIPGDPMDKNDLPWHIGHPTANQTQVFGLTLGQSNTNDAERRFKESAIPSLFKSPEGKLVAEVFFEQVDLAGLRSRIVLTVAVPESELQGMFERGLRMSGTGSGKKITLTPEDISHLRTIPISSLTYMPGIRIEEEIILHRFGQPAQKIHEKDGGSTHWLYPQNGLDITLGSEKPIMQYVQPDQFDRLRQPLLDSGEVIQPPA